MAHIHRAELGDELEQGFQLRPWRAVVSAERQRRYHEAAQVPDGLFGGAADLSILANDTILATRYLKTVPLDGLHAGQTMRQLVPVRLGEPLTARAQVVELRRAGKGLFIRTEFAFEDASGAVKVRAELSYFRVDPQARIDSAAADPAFEREGWTSVARKILTPARVAAYSHEFPEYRVHFDPAVAASVGLRAPVAQGLMSFTWMMQALAESGLAERFGLSAVFRRPIFWDESVEVLRRGDKLAVVGEDGRLRSAGTKLSAET
jgi:acyl dehydratase